jgi:hypothetical protein
MSFRRSAYDAELHALVHVGETVTLPIALQEKVGNAWVDQDLDGAVLEQRVIDADGEVLLSAPGVVVLDEDDGQTVTFALEITEQLLPAGETAVDLRHLVAISDEGEEVYLFDPVPFRVRMGARP